MQEYGREWKGTGKRPQILEGKQPRDYLQVILQAGKRDPETKAAALRLEEKIKKHPNFERAVVDSFIASSSQEGNEAVDARHRLFQLPYLQYPNYISLQKELWVLAPLLPKSTSW